MTRKAILTSLFPLPIFPLPPFRFFSLSSRPLFCQQFPYHMNCLSSTRLSRGPHKPLYKTHVREHCPFHSSYALVPVLFLFLFGPIMWSELPPLPRPTAAFLTSPFLKSFFSYGHDHLTPAADFLGVSSPPFRLFFSFA